MTWKGELTRILEHSCTKFAFMKILNYTYVVKFLKEVFVMKKVLLAGVLAVSMVVSNAFADGETGGSSGVGAGGAAAGTTVGAMSTAPMALPAAIIIIGAIVIKAISNPSSTSTH
jgi:hypothetical protein